MRLGLSKIAETRSENGTSNADKLGLAKIASPASREKAKNYATVFGPLGAAYGAKKGKKLRTAGGALVGGVGGSVLGQLAGAGLGKLLDHRTPLAHSPLAAGLMLAGAVAGSGLGNRAGAHYAHGEDKPMKKKASKNLGLAKVVGKK